MTNTAMLTVNPVDVVWYARHNNSRAKDLVKAFPGMPIYVAQGLLDFQLEIDEDGQIRDSEILGEMP